MSADMAMPSWRVRPLVYSPSKLQGTKDGLFGHSVKANKPEAYVSKAAQSSTNNLSKLTLVTVVVVHVLVFGLLLTASKSEPKIDEVPVPITVSLISAPSPKPELVPVVPAPPQPKQEIKKQIQPREVKPTPQQLEPAPTTAVEQAPTSPAPVASAAPSEVVVAKAPEVKPEPEKPQIKEDVIQEPQFGVSYLNNPKPVYPGLSRRLGEQGRVLMRVLVSVTGEVETVTVIESSGYSRLDQAATDAVKKWRFVPAKKNNQPISAYAVVPLEFTQTKN